MQSSFINAIIKMLSGKSNQQESNDIDNKLAKEFNRTDWPTKYGDPDDIQQRLIHKIEEHINAENSLQPHLINRIFNNKAFIKIAATVIIFLFIGLHIFKQEAQHIVNNIIHSNSPNLIVGLSTNFNDSFNIAEMEVGQTYSSDYFSIKKIDKQHFNYQPGSTVSNKLIIKIATGNNQAYTINLEDGTQVTLNSNSEIAFPSHFEAYKREVKAAGELYFVVAKRTHQPFSVTAKDIIAEVKGTSFVFNTNSKTNKPFIALVEGSLEMKAKDEKILLKPGEKGVLESKKFQVDPFDEEQILAFTNNLFLFQDEPISHILHDIASWYDMELEMKGTGWEDIRFTIRISKENSIAQVIDILELTNDIEINIKERRLIVRKR